MRTWVVLDEECFFFQMTDVLIGIFYVYIKKKKKQCKNHNAYLLFYIYALAYAVEGIELNGLSKFDERGQHFFSFSSSHDR